MRISYIWDIYYCLLKLFSVFSKLNIKAFKTIYTLLLQCCTSIHKNCIQCKQDIDRFNVYQY